MRPHPVGLASFAAALLAGLSAPRPVLSLPISFVPACEIPLGRDGKPGGPCPHCKAGMPRPADLPADRPWPPRPADAIVCGCCHRAGAPIEDRLDRLRREELRAGRAKLSNNRLTADTPVPAILRAADGPESAPNP